MFHRTHSFEISWALLENTSWALHWESRLSDSDGVLPSLPSRFHLHVHECHFCWRSAGWLYFTWFPMISLSLRKFNTCCIKASDLLFQLLCGALNSCVTELRIQLNDTEKGTALPWVHAAYHKFKNRLQNLSRMMCIEPQVTKDLLGNPHAGDHDELVSLNLPNIIFSLVIRLLSLKSWNLYCFPARSSTFMPLLHVWSTWSPECWTVMLKDKRGSGRWKNSRFLLNWSVQKTVWGNMEREARRSSTESSKLKKIIIQCKVYHLNAQTTGKQSLFFFLFRSGWNRIFSLSLFVEHMLLGIEQLDQKLTPLVLESTQGLGKVLISRLHFPKKIDSVKRAALKSSPLKLMIPIYLFYQDSWKKFGHQNPADFRGSNCFTEKLQRWSCGAYFQVDINITIYFTVMDFK